MPMTPAAWLQSLASDARFALRYFARHKATTVIIVAVLALATGANTLTFSLFQGMFLRPAPHVPDDPAHALVWMQERPTPTASWDLIELTGTQLGQLAERRETFASVAAWVEEYAIVAGADSAGAQNAPIAFVTPNYFTTIGVPITRGRDLRQADDGTSDLSAVMAEVHAEQLFGSAEQAMGKRLLVNKVTVEIVGIAPSRFRGTTPDDVEPVLFIPVSARSELMGAAARWMDDERTLSVFARLAPGASFEQATAVAQQVAIATLPDSATRVGTTRLAEVRHLGALPPWEEGLEMIVTITAIGSLGLLILLVGWMNVSSLMVAAAVARRQEIAVRLALGASRWRIVRQLVTESTIISIVGATAGAIVAFWLLSMVSASDMNGWDVAPDVGTFAFVIALAVATGILFGLSPALHATGGTSGVAGAIRDSGQGATRKSRLQRSLVVAQIALSQPLLVMLVIMLRTVVTDYKPIAPETSREVIGATFKPNLDPKQAALGPQLVADLIPRIAARPEVVAVVPAASAGYAVRGAYAQDLGARNAGDTIPSVKLLHVEGAAPGWFAVLDVPIVLGRDVMLADTASTDRPVVIGVDLAQALYGDANPLGQILYSPPLSGQRDSIAMTVVGVYDSRLKVPGMATASTATGASIPYRVYTAHGKAWKKNALLIRTRGPAAGFLPDLQRFAIAEAPQLPIASIKTLQQIDEQEFGVTVRVSALAALGALIALTLASLGLYGVVALSVRQRTREIGIRLAVGAEPMQVARMFLASGVKSAVVALAIGLPVTVAILQVMISTGEMRMPATLPMFAGVVITGVLVAVASIATWIPARRAARVDPGVALRAE
jgi:putative ABC transport system permease protein